LRKLITKKDVEMKTQVETKPDHPRGYVKTMGHVDMKFGKNVLRRKQ